MSEYFADASLEQLLDRAQDKYALHFEPMTVDGLTLEFAQITDMAAHVERLVDQAEQGRVQLPFWARIWPANMMLAFSLGKLGVGEGAEVLEVGAGLGVAGVFAAAKGADVTISDIEEDALLFARINILKNDLQDRARTARVDYTQSRLDHRYQYILACEAIEREEQSRGLVKFLLKHLAPDGEAILAKDYRRKSKTFFKLADKEFLIQEKVIGCKAESATTGELERHLISIHRLKARKQAQGAA
ncbi:MAG: methyltransferase [Desulfovibrio sp.]|nr:MAG: methyltransferase [Desulfovibrio sp.]